MILVAIGGNLPGPHGEHPVVACRAAAESLRGLPGTRFVALSNWYRSAPVPPSGQPDYVNGVARLDGDVDPLGCWRACIASSAWPGGCGASATPRASSISIWSI